MGHKFSLVLSREIAEDESAILQEAGCAGAVFMTDSHPTNADVTVTKMDFDDTASPSLAEAIEAALEAVNTVPDLTVPSLIVPAQPTDATHEEATAEEASAQESGAAVPASDSTPDPVESESRPTDQPDDPLSLQHSARIAD